jgi:hypothetical protein
MWCSSVRFGLAKMAASTSYREHHSVAALGSIGCNKSMETANQLSDAVGQLQE